MPRESLRTAIFSGTSLVFNEFQPGLGGTGSFTASEVLLSTVTYREVSVDRKTATETETLK